MESSDPITTINTLSNTNNSSSSSSSSCPPVILSPCAACKILRRRCVDKCVLAPYFPPTDPLKFTIAHRVFGASNIIKFLQELPEAQRADAVSSMVYEANARIRDPIYGCAGAICQLQKQVSELQAQLARAQAELVTMQAHHANLVAVLCVEMARAQQHCTSTPTTHHHHHHQSPTHHLEDSINFLCDASNESLLMEDAVHGSAWEPLWT